MNGYIDDPEGVRPERIKVGIADYAVGGSATTLVTSGLGSCVGVALYDASSGVAGLVHAMLPSVADADDPGVSPAKYVDSAIGSLLDAMREFGGDADRTVAKLAGGSTMFDFTANDDSIGRRNVASARRTLSSLGIEIVAEDVGGDRGRSLELSGTTGELIVRCADRDRRHL